MPHLKDDTEIKVAADELRALPVVHSVDVVEVAPHRPVVVEIVLVPGLDRVPPTVLDALARNDLGQHDVSVQSGHYIVEAV